MNEDDYLDKINRKESLKEFRKASRELHGKFCNLAYNYNIEDDVIDEVIKDIKNLNKHVNKILKECI